MTEQVPHTTLQKLTAFSLGQLIGDEADVVERHVSECDLCCQTLINLSSTEDTFVQLLIDAEREPHEQADAVRAARASDAAKAADVPSELADHPRYEVIELLGVGGMGMVYRAQHRLMERTVALKLISREMVNNSEAVERFRREVKAAARLAHVNIVAAHDAEQAGDVHFLVMEYVEGTDLAHVVTTRGALPVGEACDYISQAALGLQHAHEQGMVHRDIKPHNLMLTDDGTVKILDFGLASLTDTPTDRPAGVAERSDLTAHGSIMGTPDYISPEQAVDARSVDGRSDIYSLGATFYFLLAGRPPFDAGSVTEVLKRHADLEVERIDSIRDDVPSEVADGWLA